MLPPRLPPRSRNELAHDARRVLKELTLATPTPMQNLVTPGTSQNQPCRAFQRVALDALNRMGG
eukprot:11160998-Lingulodinium_polyedra.AAC.1